MNVDHELRRLARAEKTIADRDREIATLQAQQMQARHASVAAKESFAVALLRARGALDLPAEALAALLSNLGTHVAVGRAANIAAPPPLQAEADDLPQQQLAPETGDTVQVRVRISRNAGEEKRERLTAAGLRWNGRTAAWIGEVGRRRRDELVEAFGERVSVAPVAGADGAAVATTVAGPGMPTVVPPAEEAPATAAEARQTASDAPGGTSAAADGEAARAGSPAAGERPPEGGSMSPRPRLPVRPMFGRPAYRG